MNKIKKFLMFFILFILTMTLAACDKNEEDILPKTIILPTSETVQSKDETIYTILDEDGNLVSMKAVNHISDVSRNYYVDYGHFLNVGNNNLSFSAPILIDESLAKVPALEAITNLYYELSLNKEYYYLRLPYDIKVSYKLNDKPILAKDLVNQKGEVVIVLDIEPNIDANEYFKNAYMAQIQVPININNNKIIDSNGSNVSVLVGSTMNVAYTVMPGKSAHYELKISSTGFKFDGIQATFQPFTYRSLIDNVNIDIKEYIKDIQLISPAINEIQNNGFTPLINSTQPLFTNLGLLIDQLNNNLPNENILSQLEEIQELEQLKNLMMAPVGLINHDLPNYEEIIGEITPLFQRVEESLEELLINGTILGEYINQLALKMPKMINTMNSLNSNYQYLIAANNKINILNGLFEDLQPLLNNPDLLSLLANIDEYNDLITEIQIINHKLDNDLANLVFTMATLPNQIIPVIEDAISLFNHFSNFISSVESLKLAVNEYGAFIKTNQFTYFNTDEYSQTLIYTCLGAIYGDNAENIGLIDKLVFLQTEINQYNLGDLDDQINLLHLLIITDENTKLRPVDKIYLGFLELHHGLSVSNPEKNFSFITGIDMIVTNFKTLISIKDLMPTEVVSPVSFLSNENLRPNSIQFVIKQLPIS